jgi:hypothetical protein
MTDQTINPVTSSRANRGRRSWLQKSILVAGAFAVVATSAGCNLTGTRGEGPVKTQTRNVEAFSRVETSGGIGISVQIGPAGTLEVRAQENILPNILTEVVSGTLRLHSAQTYTTSEKVEVVITTPSLAGVVMSGGSVGRIEGLREETLDIELSGGSRLTAIGEATDLALGVTGGSIASLDGLSTRTVKVEGSGGSRATVQASERVEGSASGGTSITVIGDAELSVVTTGASSVGRG